MEISALPTVYRLCLVWGRLAVYAMPAHIIIIKPYRHWHNKASITVRSASEVIHNSALVSRRCAMSQL